MNKFTKPTENSRIPLGKKMPTVGDILKKERKRQGKSLSTISSDTKVDIKKLKALESNDFQIFDSPVGIKGFIKIYAEYLNLDSEKLLAIYRRDFGEKKQKEKIIIQEDSKEKTISWKYFYLLIPLFLLISALFYLYSQFSDFQNPPNLEILEPENNITLEEEILEIKGITDDDAIVEIGGSKVPVDANGEFITNVPMKRGENTITIRAISARNPSRETIEILYINYEPIEEPEEEVKGEEDDEDKIEEITLNVQVANNPTWVEIVIDDQLIVAQVLQPGYNENFEAERNVYVNTSILQNVRVEINDEPIGLSSDTFSIRCSIGEEELECE